MTQKTTLKTTGNLKLEITVKCFSSLAKRFFALGEDQIGHNMDSIAQTINAKTEWQSIHTHLRQISGVCSSDLLNKIVKEIARKARGEREAEN